MPMQSVTLVPGVNTQKTLAANEAGISISNLVRYKEGMVQKMGGWVNYYPGSISTSPIRDIHAFLGLRGQKYVGFGSLSNLVLISCGVTLDITPQTRTSQPAPSFSISSGSNIVSITDPGSSLSVYDAVRFDTPISVGNMLLTGAYPIAGVFGVASSYYQIISSVVASTTISSGGALPTFTSTNGSAFVTVNLSNNGYKQITGLFYPFTAPTTLAGQVIQGPYSVTSIIDSTTFTIGITAAATVSSGPVPMNGGNVFFTYYITGGPPPLGEAYGQNLYSSGAYGIGTAGTAAAGTPITTTDWILDNSGSTLLAVPRNGPLYVWSPELALNQAQPVPTGPLFNFGMFVSQPFQIIVMWGSCSPISGQQDPLLVRWSDLGDYTQWTALPTTFAGTFHLPTGSTLTCGIQAPLFGVLWTDVDVWIQQYIGQPLVYSFTRMATGCGAIGPHAADVNQGNVFWCGLSNFYMLGPNGVQVVPCTVWDYFFQQIDRANQAKVRCASNSVFNEIAWFFPINGGNGENSNYVKLHLEGNEFEWDYGVLSRTSWVDITALGNPIASDNLGNIYQHEMTNDAAGVPINAFIETGYFAIADGEELMFVDWVLPDMKWEMAGTHVSSNVNFTFYAVDYPGDIERVYGPFTVQQASGPSASFSSEYISPRLRGRLFRMKIESQDTGSFWRLGRIRFRWQPDGRR